MPSGIDNTAKIEWCKRIVMIPIEKLKAVKTIITHDNCSDGLASGMLLKDAYAQMGLSPEIRFVQYGTEAHRKLEPGPNMLFCDFSPNVSETDGVLDQEMLGKWLAAGTLVLDHHKGAKKIVEALNGVFGDEVAHPGVSGAYLAYREVWLPFNIFGARQAAQSIDEQTQVENNLASMFNGQDNAVVNRESEAFRAFDFATVAGIRDTWLNHHARWREACIQNEVLRFYPNEDWMGLAKPFHPDNKGFWAERTKLGNLLWTKHEKGIAKCVDKAWRFTTSKGTRVVVFEGVRSSSDVAESVDKDADLIMGFDYEAEKTESGTTIRKIIYSNRSHTTFNCMDFAKANGGGGHTKAAGFNIVLDAETYNAGLAQTLNPYSLAEALVRIHEDKQQGT